MNKRIRSDPEFNNLAKNFFTSIKISDFSRPPEIIEAIREGNTRLSKDFAFIIGKDGQQAERKLITRCARLLGPKFGHESEVNSAVWEAAYSAITKNKPEDEFIKSLSSLLESIEQKNFVYVCPNYLIHFQETKKSLVVGPIEVLQSKDILSQIPSKHFNIISGTSFKKSVINDKITVELPSFVCKIAVNCAREHVPEEAIWTADVALSLLRIHCRKNFQKLFPRTGKVEKSLFEPVDIEKKFLTVKKDEISIQGAAAPNVYIITDDVIKSTQSLDFIDNTTAIFSNNTTNISARFAQGLGWLTRGRRAEDRSERLLFFFTAIEALLSSDDKSAPVVQTIARQAAVILSDTPEERLDWSKKIKKLYEVRSALVHTGVRNALHADVNESQDIAETLYACVLQQKRLHTSFKEFQESLNDATYGSEWK